MNNKSREAKLIHSLPIGKNDPILQELWAIKAKMNKEAGYQTKNIISRAMKFENNLIKRG